MDERNFTFMFYGFAAAWAILAAYVAYLGAREGGIRRQLDHLKKVLQDREES